MLQLDPAVADPQEMAGRDRFDSLEERPRRARAERVEEQVDALGVGPRGDQSRGQQRLDLRAPEQPAVGLGVIQRADPHAVAAQDQRPLVPVPERDGELAPRLLEEPLAEIFVQVGPQLGVAPRGQPVPARQQLGLQLGILEDLAVLRDPDRAVLVADRLPAARQVDDRQPPCPQRQPGSMWICSSSGPRCAIAPVIASSRLAENSRRPFRSIAPAMPHMRVPPFATCRLGPRTDQTAWQRSSTI